MKVHSPLAHAFPPCLLPLHQLWHLSGRSLSIIMLSPSMLSTSGGGPIITHPETASVCLEVTLPTLRCSALCHCRRYFFIPSFPRFSSLQGLTYPSTCHPFLSPGQVGHICRAQSMLFHRSNSLLRPSPTHVCVIRWCKNKVDSSEDAKCDGTEPKGGFSTR